MNSLFIKKPIKDNNKDCMVCGKELVYTQENKELECMVCGKKFMSNVSCEDGHYVCDSCHSEKAVAQIKYVCEKTKSKNPVEISEEIMRMPSVHMHGPEHHMIVGASLLTAYHNAGGEIDLSRALKVMIQRGKQVPGGICGNWGACGAAISVGIATAIISGSSPLAKESWGISNEATSQALHRVAVFGGPRCCKRDSYLSLLSGIDTFKNVFNVELERPEKIVCEYSKINETCLNERCPFYRREKDN